MTQPTSILVSWSQDPAATLFKRKLAAQIETSRIAYEAQFASPGVGAKFEPLVLGLQQGKLQGMKAMLEMLDNLANQ